MNEAGNVDVDRASLKAFGLLALQAARGFLFGPIVAYNLNAGFVPVRKPGKLPSETVSHEYDLEYGSDVLEMHADAIDADDHVLIVDDLIATGGTAEATARLVESRGGEIAGFGFIIELADLNGRDRLGGYRVESLLTY